MEEKNWNEEWEKTIDVIEVNDKIVIKPTFRNYVPKPGQFVITIDPKMSFGTGEHETTKLVLNLLDKYINEGIRILDVGSGTGVLSIAASFFGAKYVLGIDNDHWCLENGLENIKLNNVNDKISIKLIEINDVDEEPFDLILANINRNILLNDMHEYKKCMNKESLLFLSGFYTEDLPLIQEKAIELGLTYAKHTVDNNWVAALFTN